jgi:hypothetical protein
MWVSRFSIPFHPRGHDVAFYLELSLQGADEARAILLEGQDPGDGLPVLRDEEAFRIEHLQQRQAPLLEFGDPDHLHAEKIQLDE